MNSGALRLAPNAPYWTDTAKTVQIDRWRGGGAGSDDFRLSLVKLTRNTPLRFATF